MASAEEERQAAAPQGDSGSAIYSPIMLSVYDAMVLGVSNRYIWRCSTDKVLLPLFESAMSERHLDIGVGTGYFPATVISHPSSATKCKSLTLVDLNPTALETARPAAPANPSNSDHGGNNNGNGGSSGGKFTSASIFYLLHCIPLPPETKAALILDAVRAHLAPNATLVGATILGRGRDAQRGWLARACLAAYNWRGIFTNADDDAEVFERALRRAFVHVEVWFVGVVMLFRARGPREGPLAALDEEGGETRGGGSG
ncbi:hypothetical protein ACCO45_006145 [Purpureocillium lilacinum]|uniref:Uncharacterized protein n=1 Tax=Purpureocillium lilacinum TaxID=33203 RepID=A0ACC4E0G7_PURLI